MDSNVDKVFLWGYNLQLIKGIRSTSLYIAIYVVTILSTSKNCNIIVLWFKYHNNIVSWGLQWRMSVWLYYMPHHSHIGYPMRNSTGIRTTLRVLVFSTGIIFFQTIPRPNGQPHILFGLWFRNTKLAACLLTILLVTGMDSGSSSMKNTGL